MKRIKTTTMGRFYCNFECCLDLIKVRGNRSHGRRHSFLVLFLGHMQSLSPFAAFRNSAIRSCFRNNPVLIAHDLTKEGLVCTVIVANIAVVFAIVNIRINRGKHFAAHFHLDADLQRVRAPVVNRRRFSWLGNEISAPDLRRTKSCAT